MTWTAGNNFVIYDAITRKISITVFIITNIITLFAISMNTLCIKTVYHNISMTDKLTCNTFIHNQLSNYWFIPADAAMAYFIVSYIICTNYKKIISTISYVYDRITSDHMAQMGIVVVGIFFIGLLMIYRHKKKQIEQLSQTNAQPSQLNLRIENYFNEDIFKEVWPFIQNDDITRIQWDGQTFWVVHKTKGRYKIPEMILSNEASETILHNLTNMINIPFDEHTPYLSTKIGNLIVHAYHKTMSTDDITTFFIEKYTKTNKWRMKDEIIFRRNK